MLLTAITQLCCPQHFQQRQWLTIKKKNVHVGLSTQQIVRDLRQFCCHIQSEIDENKMTDLGIKLQLGGQRGFIDAVLTSSTGKSLSLGKELDSSPTRKGVGQQTISSMDAGSTGMKVCCQEKG